MENGTPGPLGDILIIDDKPANLQLLSSILKERGHTVRAVVSGSMGLIATRTVKPDLILLDIRMPGMDGYEVCRQLKHDDALRSIPVIFISALEETFDKIKAFRSGGVDYITKPFQVEEVIARVEAQLALHQVHQQAQLLAARREREHLARDLHDAVSQTLFSTSVIAETLLFQHADAPPPLVGGLEQIHALTQTALTEMRALLLELRPDALLKVSIADLLDQLGRLLTARSPLDLEVNVANMALPPDVHLTFYRIAQEAITNIAKHARASQAAITLHRQSPLVELIIEDNGKGFARDDVAPGHFGLLNMHERAQEIGAQVTIDSALDQGTQIRLVWTEDH